MAFSYWLRGEKSKRKKEEGGEKGTDTIMERGRERERGGNRDERNGGEKEKKRREEGNREGEEEQRAGGEGAKEGRKQERRRLGYGFKLIKRLRGFSDYMIGGGELAYQQLCTEITVEFNDCSKQVIEMESMLLLPEFCRSDLASLLRAVQTQEKQKLHLTAQIQVLKKAGRPSERVVVHEQCRFKKTMEHECVHVQEITEAAGTEDAEADAEYDSALKEAIKGVQDAVTSINDHLEEVRYEIEALESE